MATKEKKHISKIDQMSHFENKKVIKYTPFQIISYWMSSVNVQLSFQGNLN